MSRAAFVIALSRVLKRQPTPEDVATFTATLLEACPEGRVYVSAKTCSDSDRSEAIANLWAQGLGVRAIARCLGIHRRQVRAVVGPVSSCSGPTP